MALCLVSDVFDDWNFLISWGIQNLKGKSFPDSLCKVGWWEVGYGLSHMASKELYNPWWVIKTKEYFVNEILRDRCQSQNGS